jgi:hypothetical protein
MKYLLLGLICINFSLAGMSQDSSRNGAPESWKKFKPGIRLAAGTQKRFFAEFGFGLQKYQYHDRHGFAVTGYYASYEWMPGSSKYSAVNGIKIGAELGSNGGYGGIEVKYQFNSDTTDVVITPKIGLGLGFVNLLYGYNLSTNKRPFPQVGKHQFSLLINTNILFYYAGKNKKKNP